MSDGFIINKTTQNITSLLEGKLYALQNVFELNGRISSYPLSARGFTPSNCYLLCQDDGALLLDTGYSIHEEKIQSQIGSVIDTKLPLHLFPMRLNEFMSVCNAMPIAQKFNVIACYAPFPRIDEWLDFNFDGRDVEGNEPLKLDTALLDPNGKISVGTSGERIISAFSAPIRLINTSWIYDEESRVLFTSDMFTHIWGDKLEGPWLISSRNDTTDVSWVRSFLLNTRYWWLEGAEIDGLRQKVYEVFNRYDIETIAPGYGCILQGKEIVEKQFMILDEALRSLDKSRANTEYVYRGMER